MIDLYCERTAAGLLNEPLNLSSNLGFLLAAGYGAQLAVRRKQADSCVLSMLVAAIGIGSMLFHAYASNLAQWLDVAPIAAFQCTFVALYLRRLKRWRAASVAASLSLFVLFMACMSLWPGPFNGSLAYLPAIIVLAALGLDYSTVEKSGLLHGATALFACSLALRSSDLMLCSRVPLGTHWAWHLCNAGVLALVIHAYSTSERYPARVSHQA